VAGTNAHVILEEGSAPAGTGPVRPVQVLPAPAPPAGGGAPPPPAGAGARGGGHAPPAAAAYTHLVGRTPLPHRRVTVCKNLAQAVAGMRGQGPDEQRSGWSGTCPPEPPPVVFLLPGQGVQYPDMARGLYGVEPAFRSLVDECADLFAPWLGADIRDVIHAPDGRLRETRYGQPALFTVEYALASLWISWGVRPSALVGHSLGEVVAACLAGVMPLTDAVRLVTLRGEMADRLPLGEMLAVRLPEADDAPPSDAQPVEFRGMTLHVPASWGAYPQEAEFSLGDGIDGGTGPWLALVPDPGPGCDESAPWRWVSPGGGGVAGFESLCPYIQVLGPEAIAIGSEGGQAFQPDAGYGPSGEVEPDSWGVLPCPEGAELSEASADVETGPQYAHDVAASGDVPVGERDAVHREQTSFCADWESGSVDPESHSTDEYGTYYQRTWFLEAEGILMVDHWLNEEFPDLLGHAEWS
jgi:hypothetical protein